MSDIEKGTTVNATTPHQAFGTRGDEAYGPHTNGSNDAAYQYAPRPTRIANPGPLGLFSFASTTFILSMYNVNTRGIHTPNVVVGMAIFTGGLAQFIAGMWEFPRGNAFGGTAFTSYGAFWMSYATILIPSSGVLAAYTGADGELANALGIYLATWMMVTFFFFVTSLRKAISFIALFGLLTLTFLLLAAAEFSGVANVAKAGGAVGIATAFVAYYMGLSELLSAERASIARLPMGVFAHD